MVAETDSCLRARARIGRLTVARFIVDWQKSLGEARAHEPQDHRILQVEVVGFPATASFDETGISVRTLTRRATVRTVWSGQFHLCCKIKQLVDGHSRFDAYFIASFVVHVSVCVTIVYLIVSLEKSSG